MQEERSSERLGRWELNFSIRHARLAGSTEETQLYLAIVIDEGVKRHLL